MIASAQKDAAGYLVSRLAAFALDPSPPSATALNEGKRIILDQLACQTAAAPLSWSVGYLQSAKSYAAADDGPRVVFHGDRLRIDQTAFVNGAFGQGAEFDDTHLRSSTHSGAVIVPTVLAFADHRTMSGTEALHAVIVGVETLIRISTAAAPYLHRRGHHVPPAVGPFGAAAAASRIMGLDHAHCLHAISIAGSHSAGLLEFTHAGGSVKRCHCGIAAMSGVRAAFLARQGITGPLAILEGRRGFFNAFAGQYNLDIVSEGLGSEYLFCEMGYKPMTSAFPAHAPLEAIGILKDEHDLTAEDIESIEIGTSRHSLEHVGVIREPRDITDAHYSVAFGAAIRLIRGSNGFYDYRDEDLKDPRFLDIVRRVTVKVDPVADEERLKLNNRGAIVTILTKDGRKLEKRLQYSKGHPKNPMSNDELTQKFRDTVTPRLGKDRTEELAERVWDIEELADASVLVDLTIKPG
jgi:2-methylcitrate dehydratase PrpD